MIINILKNNGSVVNRVSPRKTCVHEDGRMTETCSTVKYIVETYDINVA
jgi:hypothetical protein